MGRLGAEVLQVCVAGMQREGVVQSLVCMLYKS